MDATRVSARQVPLAGRVVELTRLSEAVEDVMSGLGRVVLLVGEIGVGKTRLAEEALALARDAGGVVLTARASPASSGLAYSPIVCALGPLVRANPEQVADLPHLARLWPELGPPPPVADPELDATLLVEALARLLERVAGRSMVALLLDDLHWADPATLDLTAYLIHRLTGAPVLIVATVRSEAIAGHDDLLRLLATIRSTQMTLEIGVGRLDGPALAQLAAGLLGGAAPAEMVALLAERAAGTALFVVALVRGLVDSGGLIRDGDRWVLLDQGLRWLPDALRDLVLQRLSLLGEPEQLVLRLAALGSTGVDHAVLERAAGLSDDVLLAVLAHLVDAGLLIEQSDQVRVGYRPAHPLFGEVAAAAVPVVVARRLHVRLAAAVEACRPDDLASLAHHYAAAGGEADPDRAGGVLTEAGDRAVNLGAPREALGHYKAAIALIRASNDGVRLPALLERAGISWDRLGERDRAVAAWHEALQLEAPAGVARARLHRRLAYSAWDAVAISTAREHVVAGLAAVGPAPTAERAALLHAHLVVANAPIADASDLAPAAAELDRIAESLDLPRVAIEARISRATVLLHEGRLAGSRAVALEALELAEQAEELDLCRRAHHELTLVAWLSADHAALRRHSEGAILVDRRLGAPAHEPQSQFRLSAAAVLAGEWPRALILADEAVAMARLRRQDRVLLCALGVLGVTHALGGELDAAHSCVTEGNELARRTGGYTRAVLLLRWAEATLALERDDPEAARRAVADVRTAFGLGLLGRAQAAAGDRAGALATAVLLDAADGDFAVGLAALVRGLATGESEQADAYLAAAAATFDALALPYERALARAAHSDVGSRRDALETFIALGAGRRAEHSRRALRTVGVRVVAARPTRDPGCPLTGRELEIAALVAQGLTNPQIAARLVLSVRTVTSHLEHIYRRLGIGSRTALARWMTDRDR